MDRCIKCGGVGLGLVGEDGKCNHCRSQHGEGRADSQVPAKRSRAQMEAEEVQKLIAASAAETVPALDQNGVKKMLLSLEKRINKNQLARAKYAGEPARFLESELELDEELKRLRVLAAAPEQYSTLVNSDSLKSLLALLSHENSDIAIDVITLLAELTDESAVGDDEEAAKLLVNNLVESGGIDLIIQNLSRLDASGSEEDSQGVYQTFSVIENLVEIAPSLAVTLCDTAVTKTPLLAFLLRKLRQRGFDANKLYASELLVILLQADPANQRTIGASRFPLTTASGVHSVDGVELLLEILNQYKKRMPTSSDEEECIENTFDALATCMLLPENQEKFRVAEGFELMLRCVHESSFARFGAIRTMSHALAGSAVCCVAFVDAGGLKALFPSFMGKGTALTKKMHGADAAKTEEELSVTMLAWLLQLLPATESPGRLQRKRVTHKFASEPEKIERLVELCVAYNQRIARAAARSMGASRAEEEEAEDATNITSEERTYLRRLDAGLLTLQRLCLVAAALMTDADVNLAFALRSKLYEQGFKVVDVLEVMVEHATRLAEDDEAAAVSNGASEPLSAETAARAARLSERLYIEGLIAQLEKHSGLAAPEKDGGAAAGAAAEAEDPDAMEH